MRKTTYLDLWGVDLLVLGGDEHGSASDELKLVALNRAQRQEAINNIDREEKSLLVKLELEVNLNEPVDEDLAHLGVDVGLHAHVRPVKREAKQEGEIEAQEVSGTE